MSLADCVDAAIDVWNEAGLLEDPDLQRFADRMRKIAKDQTIDEARRKIIARQVHNQSMRKTFEKSVGKEMSQARFQELVDNIVPIAMKNPTLGKQMVEDLVEFGVVKYGQTREGKASMKGLADAYRTEMLGKLRPILDKYTKKHLGVYRGLGSTKEGDLLRLAMEGGNIADAGIKADAKAIREMLSEYHMQLRRYGVYVQELDNWSPGRVMEGRVRKYHEQFKQFLRDNLDEKMHPDKEASIDYITRSILDPSPPEGRILSMSREVYLSTPEARVEYMKRFGQADFIESLTGYTSQLSNSLAQAQLFGPDPRRILTRVSEAVAAEINALDPKINFKPQSVIDKFDTATNLVQDVLNPGTASSFASAKNFSVFSLLGSAALAAVAQDSVIPFFRMARTLGWGKAFRETATAYNAMLNPRVREFLKEELGIMEHVTHLLTPDARFNIDTALTGVENTTRHMAAFTLRMSGMELVEQTQRGMASTMLSRGLVKNLDVPWNQLDPDYQHMLRNNGVSSRQWSKLGRLRESIVDPEIKAVRVNKIEDTELRLAVRSFLVRETENMVIRPDLWTRSFMISGRRGDVSREITAAATTFLGWPIQMFRSVAMRQVSMGVPGAMATGAGLFAASVVTTQLYAVARGQPEYAWDNDQLYWNALIRSGLLTPAGEMVLGSMVGDFRASPTLGPALDTASTLFRRVGKIGQAALENEPYDAIAESIKGIKTLTPNIWWLEGAVIEPAFQSMMWEYDPQFMRRREREWEKRQ